MTNKAIEVLTNGSLGEDFWLKVFYDEINSDAAEEFTESTGVKFELDDDGSLVIEDSTVRRVDNFDGEGQGSDFWVVLSVEKDGVIRYVKKDGWYGCFDKAEGVEVFPCKKIISFWTTDEDNINKTIDYSSNVH